MSGGQARSEEERALLLTSSFLEGLSAEAVEMASGHFSDLAADRRAASRVTAAASLASIGEQALVAAVAAERADGASWTVIGRALGVSRSAAHGRFSEAVEKHTAKVTARDGGADGMATAGAVSTRALFDNLEAAWSAVRDLATSEQYSAQARAAATAEAAPRRSGEDELVHRMAMLLAHQPEKSRTAVELLGALSHAERGHNILQTGRARTAAMLGRALHAAGDYDEAEKIAELAGPAEGGAQRDLLRLQHELLVGGAGAVDVASLAVDELDTTADAPLPSVIEVTQMIGRGVRVEQRLSHLEAQLQLILDRLPELPAADPEREAPHLTT